MRAAGPRESQHPPEAAAKDSDRFTDGTPRPPTSIRVHTVGDIPPLVRKLLKDLEEKTGVQFFVNTSFNDFREPMVCTPETLCGSSMALGC